MSGASVSGGNAFTWRQGRREVTLQRAGNGWMVVYTSAGRLLGPREELYRGNHRQMKLAAWDVMARVVLASRDEDEGLRTAKSAVQWMQAFGFVEPGED